MIDETILETYFARGLSEGVGHEDGQVCIETAITLAIGETLSDRPICVSLVDQEFWIRINDGLWSSPEARAVALRPAVFPQLGTAGRDRSAWARAVMLGVIREVLPPALRAVAEVMPDYIVALMAAADQCAASPNLAMAMSTTKVAAACATKTSMAAQEAAYAWTGEMKTAAFTARVSNAATWVANAAIRAAEVEEAKGTEAWWAVEAAAVATMSAQAVEAAAWATGSAQSMQACDNVLRTAVQVALRAYEQTAEQS
jgi:hypothetical protein